MPLERTRSVADTTNRRGSIRPSWPGRDALPEPPRAGRSHVCPSGSRGNREGRGAWGGGGRGLLWLPLPAHNCGQRLTPSPPGLAATNAMRAGAAASPPPLPCPLSGAVADALVHALRRAYRRVGLPGAWRYAVPESTSPLTSGMMIRGGESAGALQREGERRVGKGRGGR